MMIRIIIQTREGYKNRRWGEKNENRCYVDKPMSVIERPEVKTRYST